MLGKCLWKMYNRANDEWDPAVQATKPSVDEVVRAFVNAIKTVPKPRDNRQEPILEPHYKIVSIVHKLVVKKAMEYQAAADLLQKQPYAARKGEHVDVSNDKEWKAFVLQSLKHLRNQDKQHWHHRMIARTANIVYDETSEEEKFPGRAAAGALTEFRESIFTKTMHIQVWKPDAERPGRHCVYMERYVRYMTRLLHLLNDKANMEQLAKRVKKKSNDFHKFSNVWNEVCTTYLRLIRREGEIPPNMDEVFKSIPHEEFEILSERLSAWIADPTIEHKALDALRETLELKKTNANQMKPAPIDDLINDAWAVLYTEIARTLPGPDPATMSVSNTQTDGASDQGMPQRMGPMSLNNLVMDMNGTQINVPVTFAGSEPSRPRKIGINRREILRKAEMAINRIPEPPRAIAPASVVAKTPVLGSNVGQEQENGGNGSGRLEVPPAAGGDGDGEKRDESSERGSLHDSADDESDLSDVPEMEDVEPQMIFPNLGKKDDGEGGE
jgi:hypothetical protein